MRSTARGARGVLKGMLWIGLVAMVSCSTENVSPVTGALEVTEILDFGAVSLGRARERKVLVRNVGRAPVRISECVLEKPVGVDWKLPTTGHLTIDAGEEREIPLSFAPAALGQRAARLRLANDSERTPELTIELRGEGVLGRAELGNDALDFGKVAVRSIASLSLELINDTDHPAEVTVPEATGDDPDEFRTRPSGAVVVPAGQTLTVEVTFSPQRVGIHHAELVVFPCPTCPAEPVSLSGEGIAASLVADPREVDFGFVEPGRTAVQQVEITNVGTKVAVVHRVYLGQSTPSEFATDGLPGPVQLAEGESVVVEVSFSPGALDGKDGTLRVEATANGDETLVVPLKGHGGGPDIEVRPEALGFPRTGVGLTVEKKISIYNVGHDPTNVRPLQVTAVYIDGASSPNGGDFSLSFRNGAPVGPVTLQAGDAEAVFVQYHALRAGDATAYLHIESNDADEPLVIVPINASAKDLGPCSWQAVPEVLDFGSVAQGQKVQLSFAIRNVGPNSCAVANVRLSRSTPPVFELAAVSTRIIAPGEQLTVPVIFKPTGPATWSGLVEFDVSSPTAPRGEVRLIARGIDACVHVEPATIDFGVVGLQCLPPTRSVAVRNACALPVELYSARVGTSASDEFTLQSGGDERTLQPGEQILMQVTYEPVDEGTDDAPLFVETSAVEDPLLVGLLGHGALRPTATDTYVQPPRMEVDVLFVVDNSGSLMEEQDAISRNFDRFIQSANARGVDYHIAVTTTGLTAYKGGWSDCPGGVDGGEAGRFYPVDNSRPRILTPTTPNLRDVFAQNVKVGVCHWWEEGLEAARLALSPPLIDHADAPNHPAANDGNAGFLRPEAKLYVIWISDEEDAGNRPTGEYVDFLRSLKPGRPDLVSASAIVGRPSCVTSPTVGARYMEVVDALGGMVADICSPDWGGLLQRIGDDAFTPRTVFPLTQAPDGRDLVVRIDGNEIAPVASDGTLQWRYDPTLGDHGAVVFEPGHAPGPNSTLEITYPVPCPPAHLP